MLNNTLIKFKGTFYLAKKDVNGDPDANYKKIKLEDVIDYTGLTLSQFKGYFVVKNPLGIIIHQGSFASPDILADSDLIFDDLEVPLDSSGNLFQGTYKIQYFVRRTVGLSTTDWNSPELSVKICTTDCATCADLTLEVNCDGGYVLGTDLTEYASGADVDRILTLTPPAGAKYSNGDPAPANYTSVIATVQSDALWSTVWQLLLRAVITKTDIVQTMDFVTIEYVEARADAQAACDINLCALKTCFNKKLKAITNTASKRGGIANNTEIADELMSIMGEYIALEISRSCGDRNGVLEHYDKLKVMLDCDCGCGHHSNIVALIEPILPTMNNIQVLGSSPIIVTPSVVGETTVYTVSLSAPTIAILAAAMIYNVTSNDGSIVVVPSTSGSTKTFDLSADPFKDAITCAELGDTTPEKMENIGKIICAFLKADFSCITDSEDWDVKVQEWIDKTCAAFIPALQAYPDVAVTTEEVAVIIFPTLNDVINTAFNIAVTTPPVNGTYVVNPDKSITYTPGDGFTGIDVLTYTITDANAQTSAATVTISVYVTPNDCVVPVPSFLANVVVSQQTIPPSIEIPRTLRVSLQTLTDWLAGCPNYTKYVVKVYDNADVLLYTFPLVIGNNDATVTVIETLYEATFDHLTIQQITAAKSCSTNITCGEQVGDPEEFVIPIPANHDPVANSDVYDTPLNTILNVTDPELGVLANDTDADGDDLTCTVETVATTGGGSVDIHANGTFDYTPLTDFTGVDTFNYTVSDGWGGTAVGTVFITVGTVPDAVFDFDGTTIELCTEPIQGRIDWTVTLDSNGVDLSFGNAPYTTKVDLIVPNEGSVTKITTTGDGMTGMIVPSPDMRDDIADVGEFGNNKMIFYIIFKTTPDGITRAGTLTVDVPTWDEADEECTSPELEPVFSET